MENHQELIHRPRTPPPPDVYASCPQDGQILEYYSGVFDWVYIMLSPFIRPVTLSIEQFTSESYPTRREIQKGCQKVYWSEILRKAQLENISEIDVGLRTSIGGLRKEFEDDGLAKRLLALESDEHFLLPAEGEHPDLLHDSVLGWLQELGYDWVWVGDEFCRERKLYWIDDLLSEDESTIQGYANVFTPDKKYYGQFIGIATVRSYVVHQSILQSTPLKGSKASSVVNARMYTGGCILLSPVARVS